MAKKKEFTDEFKLQAHKDMLDSMTTLLQECKSDLDYATSAMFDAWAMLRVIDKEQTDELDMHAVINCAIARLQVAFDIMECMKNDK